MTENFSFAQQAAIKERTILKMGALKLYLDFINMFLFILRIFGRRS